jgi:hypothetical protein
MKRNATRTAMARQPGIEAAPGNGLDWWQIWRKLPFERADLGEIGIPADRSTLDLRPAEIPAAASWPAWSVRCWMENPKGVVKHEPTAFGGTGDGVSGAGGDCAKRGDRGGGRGDEPE